MSSVPSSIVSRLCRRIVQPAYLAALSLVGIQVGTGLVMKGAQKGDSYTFSPSGSVAISEFCKLILSTIFLFQECDKRYSAGFLASSTHESADYSILPESDQTLSLRSSQEQEDAWRDESLIPEPRNKLRTGSLISTMGISIFWDYFRGQVPTTSRWGFCNLALFYVLVNNLIFISYKIADPGTVQLMKSSVTFMTAIVVRASFGKNIPTIQWSALVLQGGGLVLTQYSPGSLAAYPISTYLLLLFQVFLSAISGVYNQVLLENVESSLHALNMTLYAAGAVFNLVAYFLVKTLKVDEPGLFVGYDSFSAIMVIISNVFVGLATTAVYKYADAIIKCLATAVATGILVYVSPFLFYAKVGLFALPGTAIVFLASWVYLTNQPPASPENNTQRSRWLKGCSAISRKAPATFLGVMAFITFSIAVTVTIFEPIFQDPSKYEDLIVDYDPPGEKVVSRFRNTLAMIRWNSALPQRIPLLRKYEPFFDTVHISMPDDTRSSYFYRESIESDNFKFIDVIYMQVAHTMQIILDEHPDIDGLFFFHFDAWIDPLRFGDMDLNNIWLAGPPASQSMCSTDRAFFGDNHRFADGFRADKSAILASDIIDSLGAGYKIKKGEFCEGWSDIYYVPRRFFGDFILMATAFARIGVFHEVAIPTILHIIDQTRRSSALVPVLDKISDCWGHCCASNPSVEDVVGKRCGHRLEYREKIVSLSYYRKLDIQAEVLLPGLNTPGSSPLSNVSPFKNETLIATIDKSKAEADFRLSYVEEANEMIKALE